MILFLYFYSFFYCFFNINLNIMENFEEKYNKLLEVSKLIDRQNKTLIKRYDQICSFTLQLINMIKDKNEMLKAFDIPINDNIDLNEIFSSSINIEAKYKKEIKPDNVYDKELILTDNLFFYGEYPESSEVLYRMKMTHEEFKEKRNKYIINGDLNRNYPLFTIDSKAILLDLNNEM